MAWHNDDVSKIQPETRLLLTLKMRARTLQLELSPSTALTIGRASSADILLDEASVSAEHLQLFFNGTTFVITDMGTTNGTFRLPSEAPFVEAEFSTVLQSLSLRLGKSEELFLEWKLNAKDTAADITKTAFDSSSEASEGSPQVQNHMSSEARAATTDKISQNKAAANFVVKSDVVKTSSGISYFKSFALLVYSASVLALSQLVWSENLNFVSRIPKAMRGIGLGIDILAVSLEGYSAHGWMLVALSVLLMYGFYRFWIRPLKIARLRWLLGAWAVLVSFWPLVYPFVLAGRNGVRLSHVRALKESRRLMDTSAYTLEEKTKMFSDLLPQLRGSSYFYSKVLNIFFERVISECGGSWKDDWNKKKLCLVLINSVTVEALSDMKPSVLAPVALRLVLITSIDSIMRIFPVEGPASEMNDVFLKSIESVGLSQEAARLRGILKDGKTTSAQKLDALQKLKISVELRLETLNHELAIPSAMRVSPPDVLALGI